MNYPRGEPDRTKKLYIREIPQDSFILGIKSKGINEVKKDKNFNPIYDIKK